MLVKALKKRLKNTSQCRLAEELGCSQALICRVVKGDYMPSIDNLSVLAEGLGVPLAEAISEIQANKAKVKKEKAAG
ncbi:helix-turn-helix transcriptional regulator [Vibrio parahaemolyticus]|nr:helix-turn-helix transcriptional regulator [Vibrio parahaemolyticus]HAV1412764.1 helix-turn-helix transcriptional regulator [Vibrio parahaemolyticus]HAV2004848.1 helix-turn-helix transcriptional regulator [Vibrio parahaemolyticus]